MIWFDDVRVCQCVLWHMCIIREYLFLQHYKCFNWWSYSYQYGHTPLYIAASNGHLEILLLLLEGGASIDDLDQVSLGRNIYCLSYCSQLYLSWFDLIWWLFSYYYFDFTNIKSLTLVSLVLLWYDNHLCAWFKLTHHFGVSLYTSRHI